MRAGDTIQFDVALFDAAGAGLSYANRTAFEAASWALVFIDMATGAAVTPALTYTIAPVAGVTGRHTVTLATTTATWFVRITPPTVNHSFSVLPSAVWSGDQYDSDSIYARLNTIYGVTSQTAVPTLALNSLVEGDSYSTTITVPTSYLSRMGWTNLTGATLHGTIYRPEDDGSGTAAATLTTGSTPFVEINGTDPTAFNIRWDTYPAGMVLTSPERAAGSVNFRVEVQAVNGAKKLTILYNAPMTVYRQDDEA